MKFKPLTEEEMQSKSLLPDGIYNYQVIKSEDKISKSGNEYISITLKVWDREGKEHIIFTNMALIKLLKHFCDVNDMLDDYQTGNIDAIKFLNKNKGNVTIGTDPEKPNPNGSYYAAKNIVKDYIKEAKGSMQRPLPENDDFLNDVIPF
jgi:Protein of unknown function (DUF669)